MDGCSYWVLMRAQRLTVTHLALPGTDLHTYSVHGGTLTKGRDATT